MKVLLLNPPFKDKKRFIREGRCTQEEGAWGTLWPPLSLASIGAVLEKSGHEVKILDSAAKAFDRDDLVNFMRLFLPEAVVLSTGTPSIDNDLALCAHLKKNFNKIHTVVFGTHTTALDKECMLKYPGIDFIVRNEPEISCRELLMAIEESRDLKGVDGITYRSSDGKIIANQTRFFIDNLDDLPFPAWHLVEIDYYRLPLKGECYLTVSPSRGCPYRCTFCTCQTYYGNRLRKRSVENILDEIEYDLKKFNVNNFFFWAETFVLDKNFVTLISEGILKRGLKISWAANSRVDNIDGPLLEIMAKSGCWMLSYGIESAEQSVLDRSLKGTKIEQFDKAISLTRKAGIKTTGHFMLGLPGDSEESMQKTIDLALRLDLDFAQFYSAVPFPGSSLYEEAVKEEWIKSGSFEGYAQNSAIMMLPLLSPDRVNYYRGLAYKRFYLNPKRFISTLKLLRWKGIKNIIRLFKSFVGWIFKG